MKKTFLLFLLLFVQVSLYAQEYFPEGTKWTEIRLDTLKYDSWYSKVDGEWVPNFETIEYYVQGEFIDDSWGITKYTCVYTNGPEWSDSLTLMINEMETEYDTDIRVTTPFIFENFYVPACVYQMKWYVGKELYSRDIIDSNITGFPPDDYVFGTIEEIKEGDFGGVRPLEYVDLEGGRIIHGIGVTEWNDGECLFGPAKLYSTTAILQGLPRDGRHYRSMLVHFERGGEVLYDVWPRKGNAVEVAIDGLNYFLNLKTHEAVIIPGNNCSGEVDISSEVSYNEETFVVKSIFVHSFYDNTELTKVRIPKTIESIGHNYPWDPDDENPPTGMIDPIYMNPFKGCTALESIEVDEENPCLKSIDGVLFSKDGIKDVYIYKAGLFCYPEGAKQESYSIPEGVEWIGGNAFYHNSHLSSLTLPNSMNYICDEAFYGCSNLRDVYCYAENVPITEGYAFEDTPIASATLHVPAGSIEEYKATSPWNEFGNIVEIAQEEPVFLTENTAWVDGFGYEQDGQYKTNDVKLFYYTTAGDTLINDKTYSRILKTRKCRTFDESKIEIQDDTLCFFMREDESGDVWLYTEDKNVFYEISHNTLYEYIAENLVGRDLFLFNAKKKYAVGDALPLGMSVLEYPDGFQEGQDYWRIYSLDIENVSEKNLLDGKTYPIYNNYFVESIGPLDGPLSGIGSPNTYNLDLKQLFAFYRDGQLIYKNEDYLAALEEYFPNILDIVTGENTNNVTFTQDQMATIILPVEPDASKGKYYRLDRVEDRQIIFEQELQPCAHVPYIIVPSEDFSIDLSTLDLAGCYQDTISIEGISFIGSYVSEEIDNQEGFYIDIIDTTPDCRPSSGVGYGEGTVLIGALRAYLQVNWDDPYNPGGMKGLVDKMRIVLHDYGTILAFPLGETGEGVIYDLQGRLLPDKPARGIYIENRKKKATK